MRTIVVLALASTALLLTTSCNKAADKPSDSTANGEVAAAAPFTFAIGGQLIDVGAHKVELRVFAEGRAEARVLDARGKELAAPEKAKLTLHASAKGGPSPTAIEMAYEPVTMRFAGATAGKADLEAGPIDVELKVEDATAHGRLDAPVLLVGPEMGGTLFVAGKYGVELVVRGDGNVEAIVRDAAGVKVTGDVGAKLEATLATAGGATTHLALAWDPPKARFVGKVDSTVKLAAGPAEIFFDGKVAAKLPKLALRAEASHGGRVLVAGDYSIELVGKGDVVNAFVFDASGAAVAKVDLDLSMRVGTGAFAKLAWDAPSASYKATIDGKLDFAVAPVTVVIKADANALAAVGASIPNVDAKAELDARAVAKAKGGANAKAKVDANVRAPAAQAQANAHVKPVTVNKSASASAGTGAGVGASANAGISIGTK
jgi:hypothetical protein